MSIVIDNLTVTFKSQMSRGSRRMDRKACSPGCSPGPVPRGNRITAVDHASLEIPGGIFGLLGENGAGKTTLMRVLTTVLTPSEGSVSLDGIRYEEKNYREIQKRIGYLPQEIDLYPNLTVQECLEYMGELSGVPKRKCKERIDELLERTSLAGHRRKKMRQLSGGMKRRAGLIQAILHEPDFLIVDEPTTGLDPEERIRIRNLLAEFSKERTVLFSTHVVEDLAATCNNLAVMKKGRFLYAGGCRELVGLAKGHVWLCRAGDEAEAKRLEQRYHVSAKQYTEQGTELKLVSESRPDADCRPTAGTLEDAYIYVMSRDREK